MDFPTIILDELILNFSKSELLSLRGINHHWNSVITPVIFDCFVPYVPYSGELQPFSEEYLIRFGKIISEVCLDNFCPVLGNQILEHCPSLSSLVLRNEHYGDYDIFPDSFYTFLETLPTLKKFAVKREIDFTVLALLLKPLTQLKTLELYADGVPCGKLVELFSNFQGSNLETLHVVFGQLSPELTQTLTERCPKLKQYNFRIGHYSSDNIRSFSELIPGKEVVRADIEIPDTVNYGNLVFDLTELPNLHHLGLNVFVVELQHIESQWPQIQTLHLWGNFSSFPLMIDTLFPNLTSLNLSLSDAAVEEYNTILKNATKLLNLVILVVDEVDRVFDLPPQKYALKGLSVILATIAAPSLFEWISRDLPSLTQLSITSYSSQNIEDAYFQEPVSDLPITQFFTKAGFSSRFWLSFSSICPNLQDIFIEAGHRVDTTTSELPVLLPSINFPLYYALDKAMLD